MSLTEQSDEAQWDNAFSSPIRLLKLQQTVTFFTVLAL